MYFNGGKGIKNDLLLNVVFLSNHQTINIYRDIQVTGCSNKHGNSETT